MYGPQQRRCVVSYSGGWDWGEGAVPLAMQPTACAPFIKFSGHTIFCLLAV